MAANTSFKSLYTCTNHDMSFQLHENKNRQPYKKHVILFWVFH